MDSKPAAPDLATCGPTRSLRRRAAHALIGFLLAYFLIAYFLMPVDWRWYMHRHPSLNNISDITRTSSGIPGDPLNVALMGTEYEMKRIMLAAGWSPADPLTFRSCLKIAAATVLKRPDEAAPVSNLYLFGRKEDFAFEQPVGVSPRKRHHVRFWLTAEDVEGVPVWVGSATYDERVGLSDTTGQITHHIAADIDAERDHLFDDLKKTGQLSETYGVADFHKVHEGRNGGGDPWHTDGCLDVGVIVDEAP
jgi:hypothetical protein